MSDIVLSSLNRVEEGVDFDPRAFYVYVGIKCGKKDTIW